MPTLKEQTQEKHNEAENLPFIKSIFENNVDTEKYTDYLFQLAPVYHVIEEGLGITFNLFTTMPGLKRTTAIIQDFNELSTDLPTAYTIKESTMNYINYLSSIDNAESAMAHVYVRHMGDLFGGQQLATLVPGSGAMYKFENMPELIRELRSKINDAMGPEAIVAFDHNINIIKEYS
jgi:heme oxygenase